MKIIAFYLPQYHEIPENSQWWGEGFTEWTNVKRAKPLFENHYQPRIPLHHNYYCLMDQNQTFHQQISIAKTYGIYGFCMYHYWFNGRLLLEKPMEQWLKDKSLDFPYCICWANENWTNGWVSGENKILIGHDFTDREDWVRHFQYLLPYFQDERYIRVDGKPFVGIYVPDLMGDSLEEFVTCWRELAIQNGLPGLTFFYQSVRTFLNPKCDKHLFDYGIEFQPGYSKMVNRSPLERWKVKTFPLVSQFLQKRLHFYLHRDKKQCSVMDYDEMWHQILSTEPLNHKMFPGAFVDWDNTARKGHNGDVFFGAAPEKFETYMTKQIERARNLYEKEYLFLFAWNEWGECGYMEPDERFGYGYLEALKHALEANGEFPEYPESEQWERIK